MTRPLTIIGCIAGCVILAVLAIFGVLAFLFELSYPPQPAFGFTGDWRSTSVFGYEERPLPPAATIRDDFSNWQPRTEHRQRLYLARLGGSERQSHFVVRSSKGETPMGAQRYTTIEFDYTDPTNGTYHLTWTLRGTHDPSFLKFDSHYRLYQLQLSGDTNAIPPRLFIEGIEGIRPEHYSGP